MTRRGLILVLAWGAGLLVGLGIAWAGSQSGKSWIDAPLGDVVLKVGEALDITAHATDPTGVDDIALLVDGETVDMRSVGGGTLEYARLRWTPSAPGTFGLSVWGRSPTGGMSLIPGTLTVVVEADTTTTTRPQTTTTAPSTTTTTTACDPMVITAPPLFTPAHNATGVQHESVHFSWGLPGCSFIDRFQIQVAINSGMAGPFIDEFIDLPATSVTREVQAECDIYWRVRAWRFDTAGPWSVTRTFKTAGNC